MYVYVDSAASLEYFKENKAVDFRVKLAKQLTLQGSWEVAVVNVGFPAITSNYKAQIIYINSSICQDSVLNGTLQPILSSVHRKEFRKGHVVFSPPSYVRVNTDQLTVLRVYLRDSEGQSPSFHSGALYCTLHFRKCLHS